MFDFLGPFATATIGIDAMFAVFVLVAQMISRRGRL